MSKTVSILLCLLALFGPGLSHAGQTPQRIISLAPAITEALFQMSLGNRIVGVTTYCTYPAQARRIQKIGTMLEPNLELMVSLKPDIILASETNYSASVGRLTSLGMKVLVLPPENNFADICNNLRIMGSSLRAEKEAEKIIVEAKRRIQAVRNRLKGTPRRRVFLQLGADPVITTGRGTYADDIIIQAGGVNVAEEAPARYVQFSREKVVKEDPDTIIMVAMGDVTGQEIDSWNKYKTMKAVAGRRILVINAYPICSPNPLCFAQSVEQIAKALHPGAF